MLRSETVWFFGSTIHTAGWRSNCVKALAGISIAGADLRVTLPTTVAPSRIAADGWSRATLTSKVRVTGSACGATSLTRPVAVAVGSSASLTAICDPAGAARSNLRRHVEHRVKPALPGDPDDHLPRLHDLAGLGTTGGHGSSTVGLKGRIADPVLGNLQLRRRVVYRRLGILQRLLCLIKPGSRRMTVRQQLSLTVEMIARIVQLPLRGSQRRLRRTLGVQLVFRIQFRNHLTWLDPVADIDRPFDHPPADTKREGDFVLGLDVSRQHHRLAGLRFGNGYGSHRPHLGRRLLSWLARHQNQRDGWHQQPSP